ncbi:hypothetical protein ACA097_17290 [Pseudomonas sp. QL9]|uniref:hypothetical protein n=1 Tax=Pseudomonas sp. QL9 TaxID=3242725 RepID=UPI00352A702C
MPRSLLLLLLLGAASAHAEMKLGTFSASGPLLVADTFDNQVIHKSDFSSDDLKRMAERLETQQRALDEQSRTIERLERQLSDQQRAVDDLKRSR